jgi:hypothetical protein
MTGRLTDLFPSLQGYCVTPWITGLGFRDFGITTAAVATAFNLSTLVMIKYGKTLRRRGQGYYRKVINW